MPAGTCRTFSRLVQAHLLSEPLGVHGLQERPLKLRLIECSEIV
jgi:hypothetical protein